MLKLTPTEELVMECLWESGEDLMLCDIREKLMEKTGKYYANNAAATFWGLLLKKGAVSRYKKCHSHQYHAEIDFEEYRGEKLAEFKRPWYGGSTAQLLTAAVKTDVLTEEEKEKMRELPDENTD